MSDKLQFVVRYDKLKEAVTSRSTELAPEARHKVARGKRAAKRSAPPPGSGPKLDQSPERAIEKRDCGDGLGANYLSSWHKPLSPFQG